MAVKTKEKTKQDEGHFGIIEKGHSSRVEVYASEFNGNEYLHVREHYLSDDGTWLPSKKGITLREADQIEDLIKALELAKESGINL